MAKPTTIHHVSQKSRYVNMMLYGIPGSRKTLTLGSSPNCLVLECGTGETDTIAAAGLDVDVWTIGSESELSEAYEYCRHEGCKEYDWCWVDGLTPLEGLLMRENMDYAKHKNPDRSLFVPDKREYQLTQNAIDRYVGLFVDLPMHTGFTAHVGLEPVQRADEDGDLVEVNMMMPLLQGGRGKLSQKVCGYMNVVAFMDILRDEEGKEIPAILVRGDGVHVAKDRFYSIGNENGWMLEPSIPKIMAKVQGKLARPASTTMKKAAAKKAVKKTTAKKTSKAAGLRTR